VRNKERRVGIAVFLLLLLSAWASPRYVAAMLVVVTNSANYYDSQDPCAQDDNGHCWITSYLNPQPLDGSELVAIAPLLGFSNVFTYGGPLPGTLTVTKFKTFDEDYVGQLGGVEITASYVPNYGDNDPLANTEWCWAQVVTLNYRPGEGPAHLAAPDPVLTTMDDATFNGLLGKPRIAPDPLYPYQYWPDMYGPGSAYGLNNGDFYDRPAAFDHLGSTIFFHAEAFLVSIDHQSNSLTAYEGFSYGWDFTCVPEPTTLIIWSLLGTLAITVGLWHRRSAA
jgi:hypothetical protein